MDTIADMLSAIRNAQKVDKSEIFVPFSKIKYEIARIMEKTKSIEAVEKKGRGSKKKIRIQLLYHDKKPAITGLKRISKPGQRIYVSHGKIKPVRGGFGIAIISTSRGLMTNKEAAKHNLGGEVICEIW